MFVLGLTGSIGMGKSTAAAMLRRLGVPVHDADAAVHRVYAQDRGALAEIAAAFPGRVRDGAIDRQALGAQVFGDPDARQRLEAILHPRVRASTRRFLQRYARARTPVVALDIPLLFETGGDRNVDAVLVVSAPAFIQRQRVMARPGMTAEKFAGILRSQTPNREKRRLADYVVETGLGKHYTWCALRRIVEALRATATR
ncbi:MAG: dephospho-CoA kinase [Rhodospirillaceae bacterium]|jgi:dephospho-CoA kinase